jgi:hypothetical protein
MTGERGCENCRRLLDAWLDGELDRDEHAAVAAHLHECVSCRAELDDLKAVDRAIEQLEAAPRPAASWSVMAGAAWDRAAAEGEAPGMSQPDVVAASAGEHEARGARARLARLLGIEGRWWRSLAPVMGVLLVAWVTWQVWPDRRDGTFSRPPAIEQGSAASHPGAADAPPSEKPAGYLDMAPPEDMTPGTEGVTRDAAPAKERLGPSPPVPAAEPSPVSDPEVEMMKKGEGDDGVSYDSVTPEPAAKAAAPAVRAESRAVERTEADAVEEQEDDAAPSASGTAQPPRWGHVRSNFDGPASSTDEAGAVSATTPAQSSPSSNSFTVTPSAGRPATASGTLVSGAGASQAGAMPTSAYLFEGRAPAEFRTRWLHGPASGVEARALLDVEIDRAATAPQRGTPGYLEALDERRQALERIATHYAGTPEAEVARHWLAEVAFRTWMVTEAPSDCEAAAARLREALADPLDAEVSDRFSTLLAALRC